MASASQKVKITTWDKKDGNKLKIPKVKKIKKLDLWGLINILKAKMIEKSLYFII